MFVCGPTVQSLIHMGHARTYVFYDTVARYMTHLGYKVNYLMNITDQDERITQAAKDSNADPVVLARRFSDAFLEDMTALKCTSVTRFELVSSHVESVIQQVITLVDRHMAYVSGGWVYFDTSKFRRFGRLSHQSKRQLSLRPLELSVRKKHLNDFALWRPEILVEGRWKSPWGTGSPGWHIQDTAVTIPLLGPQYDIHGGAYELVYPHHEAQIAQAESITGLRPFVRYWVHTHHMNMSGRKMSKSTGNALTVRDALSRYSVSELRLFLLSTHYRKDMDLSGMEVALKRLRRLRHLAEAISHGSSGAAAVVEPGSLSMFEAAMDDDIDTPRAISWIERTLEKGVEEREVGDRKVALAAAVAGARILGVDLLDSSSKA
jgi:cysteinyl-tRNA synthetase